MKNLLILLGVSALFTAFLSLIFAIGWYFLNGNFAGPFFMAFAVITFIGYISNRLIETKAFRDVALIQYEREKLNLEQSVEVICSYCKQMNVANVKLGQRNTFKCKKCNQDNLIIFQFGTAQITKPIILPDLGAVPVLDTVKPTEQVPV